MDRDPLSPMRGVIIGAALGLVLWVLAIWIAKAIIAGAFDQAAGALR